MIATINPNQERVELDMLEPAFLDGVERRKWRVVGLQWPYLLVGIAAGDGGELGMRIELDQFPTQAPAGIPWILDEDRASTINELPTGARAERIFRSGWSQGHEWTPYMASERLVTRVNEHPEWQQMYPSRAWNVSRHLSFYLEQLHRELRSCGMPVVAR